MPTIIIHKHDNVDVFFHYSVPVAAEVASIPLYHVVPEPLDSTHMFMTNQREHPSLYRNYPSLEHSRIITAAMTRRATIWELRMTATITDIPPSHHHGSNSSNNNTIKASYKIGTLTKKIKPHYSSPVSPQYYNHPSKHKRIFSASYLSWRNCIPMFPASPLTCMNTAHSDKRIQPIHHQTL